MEQELKEWCKNQWNCRKVVTRGIMFRKSLELYPGHCGGRADPKCFARLKKWFYGGFKKRCRLSKRRVSSTGQKLPKDWRAKKASIMNRVAGAQMPTQRANGSFRPGVEDDKMGNTDQMPLYIEDHHNAV